MLRLRYAQVLAAVAAASVACAAATAQPAEDDDGVLVRVIDTGPGLATITRAPGGRYFIYDTGHWRQDDQVMAAIRALAPEDATIDLMVLSHTDGDHLGAVPEILAEFPVNEIIRPGLVRDSKTWEDADEAIGDAAERGTNVVDLRDVELAAGTPFDLGDASVRFVAGWHAPPRDWDIDNASERNNAGSIIMRLDYEGCSVLFTGDAVGKHLGRRHDGEVIATEKHLLEQTRSDLVRADVLIAPHHGGEGAGTSRFLRRVRPQAVIYSAGHQYRHPASRAARRARDSGLAATAFFRTDLGDDEGRGEWSFGRIRGERDPAGDDTVDVRLCPGGDVRIAYVRDDAQALTCAGDSSASDDDSDEEPVRAGRARAPFAVACRTG